MNQDYVKELIEALEELMVTKTDRKIIYTRIDRQLWAEVKKSAELEGLSIQDWLAKVLIRAIK